MFAVPEVAVDRDATRASIQAAKPKQTHLVADGSEVAEGAPAND